MAHVSLYRKYRPASFDQVMGQEHVTRTLVNAIDSGKISHAYLFAGSRGTGKTSTAKLLAKALDCINGPTSTPCGVCDSCVAISAGTSLDVIEMDAASNRGIDDIRDIRDKVAFATVEGKYKVYILDEAHMLTKEASNAFLKVLEEPPGHVIFVLCTTEAHKVLPTIQSRCQKFEFRRPDAGMVLEVLKKIAAAEEIEIDEAGLEAIARSSAGAFRDAIGALDQLATYCDKKIAIGDVLSMLGTVESELLFEAVDIAAADDARAAFLFINRLADQGKDFGQFAQELIGHLRNIFLLQQLDDYPPGIITAPAEDISRLKGQARLLSPKRVVRFVELLTDALSEVKRGSDPRLQLELAFMKMTRPQVDMSTKSLLYRLDQIENRMPSGRGQVARGQAPALQNPSVTEAISRQPAASRQEPAKTHGNEAVAEHNASAIAAPTGDKPAADVSEAGALISGISGATASSGELQLQSGESAVHAGETDVIATEAAASEPAAGEQEPQLELSLDKIVRAWSVILGLVKKRKIPLYSLLQEARPIELEGRVLVLGFPAGAGFHKAQVEKPNYIEVITEVLAEMTGATLVIKCVVAESDEIVNAPPVRDDDTPSAEDVIAMIKAELDAEEIP
ncbi:MAG: DNA polymerase III subunit gamma/tau [Thermoleophilia bacterium]|nr:DNA polymerase III subunit gamma/tau [Thermoleophilia bacterium]